MVTTGLGTGGAETMLYRVLAGLDRQHFEPTVVSVMDEGTYGPQLREAGIPVACAGFSNRVPTPLRMTRLLRAVAATRPDLILGWMYHGNMAASLSRRMVAPSARLMWNIRHCVYDLKYEKRMTRLIIRLGRWVSQTVDAAIYVSPVSERQHFALGYRPTTSLVIGNGLDTCRFTESRADREAVRVELGISKDDVVIGHVARFDPMKDHETFLQAARIVSRRFPQLKFLLVGRGVESGGPPFAAAGRDPELAGRLIMPGERRDVPRVLQAMDIFCLSSYSEGFPNAVLEAAAVGLPCVVTRVGSAPDIAGRGALVVPARDPTGLANALSELAACAPEELARRGHLAFEHASSRYSLNAVVQQYESAFNRVLAERRVT